MHSAFSAILMNIPQGITVFPTKPVHPADAPPIENNLLFLPDPGVCIFLRKLLHQADTVCCRIAIYGTDTHIIVGAVKQKSVVCRQTDTGHTYIEFINVL